VLGVASIAPAFPAVVRHFHTTGHAVGWLITAFTLPGVFLTPVLGVMADRWGRKRILVPSLFLFGVAGVACGFAGSFHALVLLRFAQGVGAAALGSLNVTIIGDLYAGRERGAAMGYNSSVLSVGTAAYPLLGGALALLGWRLPFLLPVVAIPIGLFVLVRLRSPEPRTTESLPRYFSGLLSHMNRRLLGLFFISVATFVLLYGSFLTFLPLLISDRFGMSSFVIGLILASMSMTTAATASQLGRLLRWFDEGTLIASSFVFYAGSLLLVPLMPGVWFLLLPSLLFGVAQGMNLPSILTLLSRLSPMEHRGVFMSINGMVLRLGQTLGPIVIGIFCSKWSIETSFLAAAVIAAASGAVAWLTVRSKPHIKPPPLPASEHTP
jgi:ACDE family multidrug resistance protein